MRNESELVNGSPGLGMREGGSAFPYSEPPIRRPWKCPICGGSGRVFSADYTRTNSDQCHACGGTGIVWG
jgi:DnaJ-class molecular chaperone